MFPTFEELGIKGMVMSNWFGVVGPKNMPPADRGQAERGINKALTIRSSRRRSPPAATKSAAAIRRCSPSSSQRRAIAGRS
jgi:tripartite-type tricarboxylate transporter receptor subunit TctC